MYNRVSESVSDITDLTPVLQLSWSVSDAKSNVASNNDWKAPCTFSGFFEIPLFTNFRHPRSSGW